MRFTCSCGFHYFSGSPIRGGEHLDLTDYAVAWCLKCEKRYLWHPDHGFMDYDPEKVK